MYILELPIKKMTGHRKWWNDQRVSQIIWKPRSPQGAIRHESQRHRKRASPWRPRLGTSVTNAFTFYSQLSVIPKFIHGCLLKLESANSAGKIGMDLITCNQHPAISSYSSFHVANGPRTLDRNYLQAIRDVIKEKLPPPSNIYVEINTCCSHSWVTPYFVKNG